MCQWCSYNISTSFCDLLKKTHATSSVRPSSFSKGQSKCDKNILLDNLSNNVFCFTTFREMQVDRERVEVWAVREKRYLCHGAKYLEILLWRKLSFGKPRLTRVCGTLSSWRPLQFSLETLHSRTFFVDVHLCICLCRSCNLAVNLPR